MVRPVWRRVPVTTISACRLPQWEQTSRAPIEHGRFGSIPSRYLGWIGLDLMLAFPASHDQPDAGGGSVAERHRCAGLRLHGGQYAVAGMWLLVKSRCTERASSPGDVSRFVWRLREAYF
jgi:hypothetical protein